MSTYDFIALGGGSAGFNAARTARGLGKKVAIIDGARDLGGLCILRGCMPSKTLLHMTDVLHAAQHGKALGLRIPKATADLAAMQKRKQRIIGEFAGFREQQLSSGRYDLFRSHARFVDPHTIELDDGRTLRAKAFLIGTGSRVSVPPVPGLAETPFWTSDDILDLSRIPKKVIVLGGGIVACELTQYLARLGTEVVQIQRSAHILKGFSADAAAVVETVFRREGIELHTGTELVSIQTQGSDVVVTFKQGGKTKKVRAPHLFNALGREPNTEGLGLEAAGVKVAPSGRVQTNRWQQTNQAHIYAAGDVCGPHDIVHLAVAQGELAARHASGVKRLTPVNYDHLISISFTSPAVAHLGLSEALLKEQKKKYLVASYPFNDHGKSILMDAMDGYVRVWADPRRGRLLGAEIVGPEAGELIHCLSGPLAMGATVFDLLRAPWYHPTLAEILTYPLEEIADQVKA